ncbi:hypothetical protein PTKIN_Ptkin12aG0074000 [Pterospermum kingtungense]
MENSKLSGQWELERSVRILECENGELKAQLAVYVQDVASLMDSVTSLESRTLLHPKLPTDYTEEVKVISVCLFRTSCLPFKF